MRFCKRFRRFISQMRLRSAAAEAALHLRDVALAKKLVGEMSSAEPTPSAHYMITTARIAPLQGDFEEAEKQYRRAMA
jgi:hypothetical protein